MDDATITGGPLAGVRVLEVGDGLAAAYATKLLVDLGASATVCEPPHGCALRHRPGAPLFDYLRSGCDSVVLDLDAAEDVARLSELFGQVDIVLSTTAQPAAQDATGPVVVHLSAFGRDGPRCHDDAGSLTLQAAAGWCRRLAGPGAVPVYVGGDLDQYAAGLHAAVAALTALRHVGRTGMRASAEVTRFESMVSMLPFPTVHAEVLAAAGLAIPHFTPSLPGVVACADGWVGCNPLNQQGWNDLCGVLGLDEFHDRLREVLADAALATRFRTRVSTALEDRPAVDVVELMQSLRVPSAIVADGPRVLDDPHLVARGVYVRQPGAAFVRPRAPWRLSATPLDPPRRAPEQGETTRAQLPPTGRATEGGSEDDERAGGWGGGRVDLPYSGLRVLDLTAYWAGPLVTSYLASFGADVVKVESRTRPDPFRYSTSSPALGEDWWERSAVWQSANLGKRSLTLDLAADEGQELARRLAAQADVLVENFTPRVLGHLGLDVAALRSANPRLLVLRMPAFGLDGPHRDHVAWAPTFEQASGLANLAGPRDGAPVPPGGCADPLAGLHALLGLQAALRHRDRTGRGQVIEMAQLEALLAVTAEQAIAASCNIQPPLTRDGARHHDLAPHGFYPGSEPDTWVALTVDDHTWPALQDLLDRPALSDARLLRVEGRRARLDEIDRAIATWTSARPVRDAERVLRSAGIDAAVAVWAAEVREDDQLVHRSFFEPVHRPATATYAYPRWPMRFSFGPDPVYPRPAPTLGEHTAELLRSALGCDDTTIVHLHDRQVI